MVSFLNVWITWVFCAYLVSGKNDYAVSTMTYFSRLYDNRRICEYLKKIDCDTMTRPQQIERPEQARTWADGLDRVADRKTTELCLPIPTLVRTTAVQFEKELDSSPTVLRKIEGRD